MAGLDFALSPELQTLSEHAWSVGQAAAARSEVPEDSWLIGVDREFSAELASRGWIGMTWPARFGGAEASPMERFVVVEALISAGAPLAASWFADRQIGPTLMQYGTDAQQERWLGGIVAGTDMWSIGMSEPNAGSDVAAISTRAERTGDCWLVNGQKIWTSGAAEADWMYLVARTDPDAPPHKGLSEFVVDLRSPGIEIRPISDMTGNAHFCEVFLDNVEVPADHLIGQENGSFAQIMRQMEHERGGIDRLVSNRSIYEFVREQADTSNPLVRQMLSDAETRYRLGRLMVIREVLGQAPKGWSAVTKTFCTEFEVKLTDLVAAIGGADTMLWNRLSRSLCYAPGYTLMGGTTLILRNIVGERILGLPREPRAAG